MKKLAFLLALCLLLAGALAVNTTFALPDIKQVFATLTDLFDGAFALPEYDGSTINVSLVTDPDNTPLYPGGSASHETSVKNDGTGDAYFRLAYAVQYDAATWDKLTIDFDYDEEAYAETDWTGIDVDNTPFRMKVFTYQHALAAGGTSPKIKLTVEMDSSITSEQLANYRSDFLQIQALAIETDAFANKEITTATQALDLALPLKTLNPF